jgi:UDP-glucose:(heptosyl)LPS alpha-1,3-glucosyltransferase
MRLTIVRQDYRPEGLVERVIEPALEALLERNVAVSLYTRSWPQTRLQLAEPLVLDPFHVGAMWRDWSFARAACRDVRRSQPNLVEAHERMLCCDMYRASGGVHAAWVDVRLEEAGAAARIALGLSPYNRYLLAMEKRLYASTWLRAVICNSRMVKQEIRRYYAVPESKLHVIYNPVDTELFHPALREGRAAILAQHGIAADATVFLVVVPDASRIDVGGAIDAFARQSTPSRLVVLLGTQPPKRHLAQARAAGVGDRITFLGRDADRRSWLGAADVFVWPARYDPSPDIALEAMACGLPVIASTKSGAAELLPDCDAGLVYPARDAAALAAHMQTLLDPATRARLGPNARRAVSSFSPAAITLQQVLLYRDLLASPAPGVAMAIDTAAPIHDLPVNTR